MSHFKELLRSAWDAAWNSGEIDALDEIVHPDYALENAGLGHSSGLAELKAQIHAMRAAIPDLHTTVETIIVDGDDFAIFWSATGTFAKAFGDVPPTGRTLQAQGAVHGTLCDGRIIRERVSWDPGVEMLADLGTPGLGSAFESARVSADTDETDSGPDAEELKDFNRKFVSGVTVVTVQDASGQPRGLAVSAYMSLSLDPPLVVICVQKTSSTYPALFEAGYLGINILSHVQRQIVDRFASKAPDKFAGLSWHPGPAGSPLLEGASASVEAEIKERFRAKTHVVIIARVRHLEISDVDPMIYKAGKFYDSASLAEI
ncbi:flavin reductase [Pseudodonghicola flavimaris]|uniref:Flavin reductase n=1 Tax=Pseudodonghicola flavimaris TaxID=3050036 RepID=A0ABT7EX40_9RHOB|nr:flavin reductase [Pseudodonghicola flavimaris]MDK3016850.1 flavin reductase [Pseudodonghicola flavimaris]